MSVEFDRYAADYQRLLKDPLRDRFAGDSEHFYIRKWLLLERFLVNQGLPMADSRWLDVGCGKGELLRLGAAGFREAIGCDPSEGMLRDCSGLTVALQSESTVLPFESGGFHLVTAVCVYHHLSESERGQLTREVSRILRPGGLFAIFEHNPWNPVTRLIVSRTPVDAGASLLSARHTRRLMNAAGLSPVDTSYYLYLPPMLFFRMAAIESLLSRVPAGGQYAVFGRKPV